MGSLLVRIGALSCAMAWCGAAWAGGGSPDGGSLPHAVPEPTSLLLLAAGVGGIFAVRRRRK